MFHNQRRQRAYLLRLWAEHSQQAECLVWRFNLEDPHSGQRHGFACLEALVAYLQDEMKQGEARTTLAPGERAGRQEG